MSTVLRMTLAAWVALTWGGAFWWAYRKRSEP